MAKLQIPAADLRHARQQLQDHVNCPSELLKYLKRLKDGPLHGLYMPIDPTAYQEFVDWHVRFGGRHLIVRYHVNEFCNLVFDDIRTPPGTELERYADWEVV